MKKIVLCCSLLLVCCWFCGYGQVPDWMWARSAPSTGWGEGISIATDNLNNEFITGSYHGSITFGSYLLTGGTGNVFLAKYDLNGNVKWANASTGEGVGQVVTTDVFGNSYIIGYFDGPISFGSHTLTNAGLYDIFLVKYDSIGNVLWAKSAGGADYDYGYGVATDASGNIYITGYFVSSSFTIGAFTLTYAGSDGIFLAKYDSSGNVLWAKSAGGTDDQYGNSVVADALGNEYITGYFGSPSLIFGTDTITNAGSYDIFLTKYDSSGNALWAKSAGGTGDDEGSYVAADALGNVYLTGYYNSSSIKFGSDTLTNAGGYDAFLAKYDSSGNFRWAKSIGGTGDEYGWCAAADKFNKILITGGFDSPTLPFDTIMSSLPVAATDAMYLAGYDSSGHALFAKALACGGDDNNGVASSPSGCIYIGSDFETASFIVGNDTLINTSTDENVFVAKLCYPQIGESVPEIIPTKEFILYPNPFDGKLNVSASPLEEEEFVLYDVTGRLLLRCLFTTSATVNTEGLASGLYIYEVRDEDGVGARGKVIKE